MLNRPDRLKFETTAYPAEQEVTVDLSDVLNFLSRYRYTIIGIAAACLLLAVVYLILAPVRYAATAQVIIDPNRVQVAQPTNVAEGPLDASTVESQVTLLKSGGVAQTVVANLDLTKDEEFVPSKSGLLRSVLAFGAGKDELEIPADVKQQIAVQQLQRALSVQRVGISYVIDIEFRSTDRAKSARIANAIAETYRSSQIEARNDAVRRANVWLEERLAVIRAETLTAEKAVQDFKSQSKSLDSGVTYLDLESHAQSLRRVYESFRQRYLETSQQLSFPIVEARIITPATPPLNKSEPRSTITLGLGAILGLGLGIAVAFIRDRIARLKSKGIDRSEVRVALDRRRN
ncbi:GumC family protein [Microvirga sp. 2TAF3]|uniref:GumC family protein n=1 Tax=Microvirga sp. 2TAF3 TaxID=3233014 RepID=UPI003F9A41EF